MPSSSFYRNVNRFSILVFAASKTAYPIHFVKKYLQLQKSANPQLLTLFFAGKMALLSKYCRDKTDKKPPPKKILVKTLKLTIVLQFDLEKWNNQEPKKLQKKTAQTHVEPKMPKTKEIFVNSLSFLFINFRHDAFYGFWVSLTGPAVYNGI